jgi:hypothetical protein
MNLEWLIAKKGSDQPEKNGNFIEPENVNLTAMF